MQPLTIFRRRCGKLSSLISLQTIFSDKKKIMSGLMKPKQYDWKDSNLAMFGSDEEKKVSFLPGSTKFY